MGPLLATEAQGQRQQGGESAGQGLAAVESDDQEAPLLLSRCSAQSGVMGIVLVLAKPVEQHSFIGAEPHADLSSWH